MCELCGKSQHGREGCCSDILQCPALNQALPVTRLHLQITRANFQDSLPIIQQALQDCHFFALDCEMTGLDLQDTKQEYLDEIEERYHQVRARSALADIMMIMLTCNQHQPVLADSKRRISIFSHAIWPFSFCLV